MKNHKDIHSLFTSWGAGERQLPGRNEELKKAVYNALYLIRIYTKRRGEKADLTEPMIVRTGITIGEVCDKLHRDLKKDFRYALVWGKSVKHQPQRVGLDHVLADKDIMQIIKR